ncbi:MAG TPA: hypothetical protein VLF79_03870 [Candidatus Saccharimonadales bacterium]|nr:hypothetical protein [Candidatus Saccharimonadales bacterium]
MSLSASDLQSIRTIVKEEVRETLPFEIRKFARDELIPALRGEIKFGIENGLDSINGQLDALENDVKEIYFMLSPKPNSSKNT